MDRQDTGYNPVFHFKDSQLFDAFMEDISTHQLRERLKRSQSLRNRYFAGFRITNNLPTDHQIAVAFRRDIVDRDNGELASFLCRLWIREHSSLAKDALSLFGVQSNTPEDANSWIGEIQGVLEKSEWQAMIRAVVRSLADRYPNEHLRIFISIISYGKDQEYLNQLVTKELDSAAADPTLRTRRIAEALEAARAQVGKLESLKAELQNELNAEEQQSESELRDLSNEHNRLSSETADIEASMEKLATELERIKDERSGQQKALEASKKRIKSFTKAIADRRDQLSSKRANITIKIQSTEETLRAQSSRLQELIDKLAVLEKEELDTKTNAIISTAAGQAKTPPDTNEHHQSSETSSNNDSNQGKQIADATPVGSNAICYQGIQRIFRNALVAFLRDRMTRLFPQDHETRIKKPFGDEWAKAEANARQSRAILGTTTTVRDAFDLLGTNHFYNLFDIYFDRLFTPEAGQPAGSPKPVKARFVGNLKAIKDCRDPLSHPVEEEVPIQEAQHLLYCAQEILKWIDCREEAKELALLAAQLSGIAPDQQSQLRRLPSEDGIYLDFVGRDSLLQDLSECFSNSLNKRCLLAGDGGKASLRQPLGLFKTCHLR